MYFKNIELLKQKTLDDKKLEPGYKKRSNIWISGPGTKKQRLDQLKRKRRKKCDE